MPTQPSSMRTSASTALTERIRPIHDDDGFGAAFVAEQCAFRETFFIDKVSGVFFHVLRAFFINQFLVFIWATNFSRLNVGNRPEADSHI